MATAEVGCRLDREASERGIDDVCLFLLVYGQVAGCRAGRFGPAHSAKGEVAVEKTPDTRGRERKCAHVLGLLLKPHDLVGPLVASNSRCKLIARPGVELLDSDDRRWCGCGVAVLHG